MEKIFYNAGKTVGKSYAHFLDGMVFHRKTFEIINRYDTPCEKSSEELENAGITKEKYEKMQLGSDLSIIGIAFSIGAMVDFLLPKKPI